MKEVHRMNHTVNATVLVVEDQASMRGLERLMLERAGYDVTEACSGFEALDLLGEGNTYDLVIADIAMPGITGIEMASAIRTTQPDQKILYITGHLDRLMNTRSLWEGEAFLEKPFSFDSLCEAASLLLYGTFKKPSETAPSHASDPVTAFDGPANRSTSDSTDKPNRRSPDSGATAPTGAGPSH
jgi:CheY-like chemotaxis protein